MRPIISRSNCICEIFWKLLLQPETSGLDQRETRSSLFYNDFSLSLSVKRDKPSPQTEWKNKQDMCSRRFPDRYFSFKSNAQLRIKHSFLPAIRCFRFYRLYLNNISISEGFNLSFGWAFVAFGRAIGCQVWKLIQLCSSRIFFPIDYCQAANKQFFLRLHMNVKEFLSSSGTPPT